MAGLAVEIPENGGKAIVLVVFEPDIGGALLQEILRFALHGEAREITLHIGAEDGNAGGGEAFREDLKRDRLTGPGGAGDEAVSVGETELEILALVEAVIVMAAGAEIDAAGLNATGRCFGFGSAPRGVGHHLLPAPALRAA